MSFLIRIDDRLLHGQVVEGWIKPLKIELIVICSDTVYCDLLQKSLFEMATPSFLKLECNSIEMTAEKLINKSYNNIRTLILISSFKELYELVLKIKEKALDFIFPPINVGGIRYSEGRKLIEKALCLGIEDLEFIKKLNESGIVLEYYVLPSDPKIVLNNIIEEIEKNLKS